MNFGFEHQWSWFVDYVWLYNLQLKKDLSSTTMGVAAAVDAYIFLTLSPQVFNQHFISCLDKL